MKFGRNLPRNQVPEWSESYINYKGLKRLIKAAAAASVNNPKGPDLAEFFFSLDRNVENVDGFYNKKFAEASRRLKLLHDRYGRSTDVVRNLDREEVEELMGAFLELRAQLRKLQWFGEVNRRGFIKITKKLDKKIPSTSTQKRYIESKVDIRPFATNAGLGEAMSNINDWLSALGEVNNFQHDNDNISVHSFHSLKRVSSRATLDLPHEVLDALDNIIRLDKVDSLQQALSGAGVNTEDPPAQRLLVSLLQRSISCKSKACIANLLHRIHSLDASDDINGRNCLHRLVISIGRAKSQRREEFKSAEESTLHPDPTKYITPAASPMTIPPPSNLKESQLLSANDESVKLLTYVLDNLEPHQRESLEVKDSYGRLPLHYAAEFGFVVICQIVMAHMQEWGQFNVEKGIDAPEWQDNEGLAPLHLSVINGHPLTTKALLEGENWKGQNEQKAMMRRNISKSSAVLSLATKSNFYPIVKLLVDAGVDINWQDETGETALHVAARFGHEECAKTLLAGSLDQKINIEIAENSFSWTPLHIAAVDGHLPIVELLTAAGADLNKADASGWTAREHAALRGHMDIAARLAEASPSDVSSSDSEDSGSTLASSPPTSSSLEERRSQAVNSQVRMTEPVKTFGHRYLTDESMILVSLGSMDQRKNVEAVKLDRIPLAEAHSTQLDTALSLVVSASGATGEPSIIDLPVQDNICTEPIVFHARDAAKARIFFDIVPTYSGDQENKIGRGVAVLSSIKPSLGVKRMNLQGDVSVPIMAASTLEVIGTVNFNFLVITPFSHPNMGITEKQTYWKSVSAPMVIGHRGLGKNMTTNRSLQLGENTLQSFIAAANLGANYVEFDVQLTKDHVPVIYHDFLVSETGIDAPVHTLTLEQFLHVQKSTNLASQPTSPALSAVDTLTVDSRKTSRSVTPTGQTRPRSFSMSQAISNELDPMDERMKHTRDFKAKGFKANSRNFIQAPFTTLEELLLKVPQNVGFNIEMKYPMLFESEEHEMDTYAVELNSFVDVVLKKVYDLGKKRNIIFSSFNPDICLLLSFKQPSIPILFLTDAGTCPVGDVRASSLQEAIRFASRWNLLGVVSAAEPLCNSPRLVRVVKEMGLVCVSYGTLNNDPDKVEQQVKEGIDAVIVDSVLAIRKELTKKATSKSPLPPSSSAQSDTETTKEIKS